MSFISFRNTAILIAAAVAGSSYAAQVSFVGSSKEIITVTPERNTGLDMLYVAYNSAEIGEMRISGSGNFSISRYSNLGGGYAEPVNFRMEGSTAVVESPQGDMGYIIEDEGSPTYIWLVNYLPHMLTLNSVAASAQQDCDNTIVEVSGEGAAIHYYTIDGRQCELSRDIEVAYRTLEWSDESENFNQEEKVKTLAHLSSSVSLTPPLYCASTVTVSGDRFLEQWKMGKSIVSATIQPNGVAVHTSAEQTNASDSDDPDADASNLIKQEINGIGGSAPVDMSFRAWTTDAVVHNEWQIASDEMFEYIDYRFTEQNLDYSFTEEGTYYVRFIGSNSDGSCEAYGDTYTIGVGSSELRIPNAFTPNEDGINDVWKVAYRSLLKFSCTIFDRYGNELFHFTDPSQGWDGKYKGKVVKPGVYFYVIEAQGADGRNYKKGGDINIIRSKKYSSTGSGSASGDVAE